MPIQVDAAELENEPPAKAIPPRPEPVILDRSTFPNMPTTYENKPVTYVRDTIGRQIGVVAMDAGDNMDFIAAFPNRAGNRVWMMMAEYVSSVISIGDQPVPKISDEEELRRVARMLRNEGITAAQVAIIHILEKQNGDEAKEVAKN